MAKSSRKQVNDFRLNDRVHIDGPFTGVTYTIVGFPSRRLAMLEWMVEGIKKRIVIQLRELKKIAEA